MKTLTYPQFLVMIKKSHCTHFTVVELTGSWVFYLGFPVSDNCFFSVYKSRPFKFWSKLDCLFSKASLYGLKLISNPTNIYTY